MNNIICFVTILINSSNLPLNDHDKKMQLYAQNVCLTNPRYKDDTPCLKYFVKRGDRNYWAICAESQKK